LRPTLLVTGSSGLLGRAIAEDLETYFVCRHAASSAPASGESYLAVDLTEKGSVNDLVKRCRPDVILHLAALADVDACEADPTRAYRLNVDATRNLVSAAGDAKIIYVSSDHVYDGAGANREADVRPTNVYALTKLWGEDIALSANAAALRLNFFCLGTEKKEGFAGWLTRSFRSKQPLRLFGDVFFNPIYAGFLPGILARVVERWQRGTFNVGYHGPGVSKAEFAMRLAARLGLSTETCVVASVGDAQLKTYRPRGMAMNVEFFEHAFGMRLPTLDRCLDSFCDDWRAWNDSDLLRLSDDPR